MHTYSDKCDCTTCEIQKLLKLHFRPSELGNFCQSHINTMMSAAEHISDTMMYIEHNIGEELIELSDIEAVHASLTKTLVLIRELNLDEDKGENFNRHLLLTECQHAVVNYIQKCIGVLAKLCCIEKKDWHKTIINAESELLLSTYLSDIFQAFMIKHKRPSYTKDTAPKGIKVDMDYCADPIWVSNSKNREDFTPYVNSSLSLYPFPPELMHILHCYKEAWENAHSSEYISLMDLSTYIDENPVLEKGLGESLTTLGKACEDMLEAWLKENNWQTKLYRNKNFW